MVNFSKKSTPSPRYGHFGDFFSQKGGNCTTLFRRGFRVIWGVWVRNFFPKKNFQIILGTVNEVPEKKFPEIGSSVTKKINGHLGGPHNDARPPGGEGSAPSAPMNLLL